MNLQKPLPETITVIPGIRLICKSITFLTNTWNLKIKLQYDLYYYSQMKYLGINPLKIMSKIYMRKTKNL
jgi:hypothetical protein